MIVTKILWKENISRSAWIKIELKGGGCNVSSLPNVVTLSSLNFNPEPYMNFITLIPYPICKWRWTCSTRGLNHWSHSRDKLKNSRECKKREKKLNVILHIDSLSQPYIMKLVAIYTICLRSLIIFMVYANSLQYNKLYISVLYLRMWICSVKTEICGNQNPWENCDFETDEECPIPILL